MQNHRVRVPAWAAVPALLTAVTLLAKKKWVSFPLRLALTLALFAFLFRSLSWSSLLAAIEQAQRLVIFLGLLVGVLGLQVSAFQWQCLLQAERIHVDLIRLIKLYLIGTAFSH
ncbi:MAG TPA: lysylphosphatidylglycerol synthase domain-containing protein, partial [Ktedonobacteraceae bacterium]|nr:lysylphosphatidylglycerol synthase domain-containing protein [Ktedonobacteraceae bacterium]